MRNHNYVFCIFLTMQVRDAMNIFCVPRTSLRPIPLYPIPLRGKGVLHASFYQLLAKFHQHASYPIPRRGKGVLS